MNVDGAPAFTAFTAFGEPAAGFCGDDMCAMPSAASLDAGVEDADD